MMHNRRPIALRRHSNKLIESLEARRLLAAVPSGFVDQTFGLSFGSGTAMQFAPDGRLFTLSQTGTVRIMQPNGSTNTALTIPVNSWFERGLLGITFDPNFTTNNYVYLYYTELPAGQSSGFTGSTRNRVSRFTVSGNTISAASEHLVVQLDTLSAGNHNGGAIHFGPDGKLYIATGENATPSNAQSVANRHGKILRINADGSIPTDNPTSFPGVAGTPTGANRAIWSLGLRNPYTFTFSPVDGKMFINDVGQNAWEEINIGQAGRNYGWPSTEGGFNSATFPNFTQPLYYYGHGSGNQRGFAITGGAFYSSNATLQFPVQYQNKYFFGEYVNDWMASIDPLNPPTTHSTATAFATGAGGIVDLDVGPDGAIYYLQRDGSSGVRRIAVNPATAPSISNQPQNQSVYSDESATFSVEATGAATLTYQWQRNSVDIPGATGSSYTLNTLSAADDGALFRVIIRNNSGQITSSAATLNVTVNAPAVPVISLPTGNDLFSAGETINFAGSATDPDDGALSASNLSWTIVFHHDTHTHPFVGPIDGVSSGSFVIPTSGETAANVWYRVELTATDSGGRSVTTFRDIFPQTSTITLSVAGAPASATLNLDGQPSPSGTSTLGVVGVERSIEAPATQVIGGQTYNFVSWSDGGARVHTISTPITSTNYIATYQDVTLPALTTSLFRRERTSPSAPPHQIVFGFSEPVNASLSGLTLVNQTTGQTVASGLLNLSFDAGTNQLRITAPGYANGVLPDGMYVATFSSGAVTDAGGNAVVSPVSQSFRVLTGDANDDGAVNFDDLLLLAQNYGQTGRSYGQGNFDHDSAGNVGFDDLLLLAQNYGTTLVTEPATRSRRVNRGTEGIIN